MRSVVATELTGISCAPCYSGLLAIPPLRHIWDSCCGLESAERRDSPATPGDPFYWNPVYGRPATDRKQPSAVLIRRPMGAHFYRNLVCADRNPVYACPATDRKSALSGRCRRALYNLPRDGDLFFRGRENLQVGHLLT